MIVAIFVGLYLVLAVLYLAAQGADVHEVFGGGATMEAEAIHDVAEITEATVVDLRGALRDAQVALADHESRLRQIER